MFVYRCFDLGNPSPLRPNPQFFVSVSGTNALAATAGNTSRQTGVSYVPPSVVGLSGPGVSGGATAGGDLLTVSAYGTGPLGALPAGALIFGPPGNFRFAATCTVTVAATGTTPGIISCVMPPGTGSGMVSQLTIGGQPSNVVTSPLLAYGPPILTGFSRPLVTQRECVLCCDEILHVPISMSANCYYSIGVCIFPLASHAALPYTSLLNLPPSPSPSPSPQ